MRALVLSGGAVKGAYEVGALKYLIKDLGNKYDILCGVSVGALNCGFLSMFSKENEEAAFESLLELWNTIDNSKVRKNWFPLGPIAALWKDSVYNSQPLIDLVHSSLSLEKIRQSGRNVAVGAVSLNTGEYKIFTQNDDCFVDGVLASSAFPVGLNPIKIGNELYTDGGVKHILPLKTAIDLGAIDIDVIVCSPIMTTNSFNDLNALNLGLRCFDLITDQVVEADIKMAELYNKLIAAGGAPDKRTLNIKVIRPRVDIPQSSLDFNNAAIKKMIEQGYNEAKQQY